MANKTLFYRFFGIGKLPDAIKAAIENEKIEIMDEGIRVTATFRNYRTPKRYSAWRKKWFSGSIAVTAVRIIGYGFSSRLLNIAFADPRFEKLVVAVENSNCLYVGFDAGDFDEKSSGKVEYRFHTPHAKEIQQRIDTNRSTG